ncbi:MAG: helix-turn-helix transcriptional regulator [Candidatus Xenobia bacterium]
MDVSSQDLKGVVRLWDELESIPPGQFELARRVALEGLCRLIGATNVWWVAATRCANPADPLKGWRPHEFASLHEDPARTRLLLQLQEMAKTQPDPTMRALAAQAGATRTSLRCELVDDATWQRSPAYSETMRPFGLEDRLVGAFAANDHEESYLGLDRSPHDRPFSERDRDLLLLFLHGAGRFHRELLRVRRVSPPLTCREREVLSLLLTGRSEREMAEALGLKVGTMHQYVVSVLRKFGVHSRVALMADWLSPVSNPSAGGTSDQ